MSKKIIRANSADTAIAIGDTIAGFFLSVSPIKATIDTYNKVKADLFEEKLETFMLNSQGVSDEVKNAFLKTLDNDNSEFFKRLWAVLDRFEDKEKAVVLGKLFKAMLEGHIKVQDFNRLASAIDSMSSQYLRYFIRLNSSDYREVKKIEILGPPKSEAQKVFTAVGLMIETISKEIITYDKDPKYTFEYSLSEIGRLLAKHGF